MSEIALNEYSSAREQQLTRNDARRILTRIDAARQNPVAASRRWPFELIQNAHDAGPRTGDARVEIVFRFQGNDLAVSHTGKPFAAQELAALLSGGSSKEFDDQETTGRFGTGFLATHALSTRVDVEGIIETQEGFERFVIELDRDGDEDSITENIVQAGDSVSAATRICAASLGDQPTASFIYYAADDSVVNNGLERLREALPYLYRTCPQLGKVTVEASDTVMRFDRGDTTVTQQDGVTIETTNISIVVSGQSTPVAVMRTFQDRGGPSLLAVYETPAGATASFVAPSERFPRLFVQFPLGETSALPLNVVIDGRFKPQQERDGIAMNAEDKELIANALATLPALVAHAIAAGQENAHQLARIAAPTQPLGGENATDEIAWWQETVLEIAESIAKLPVIHTVSGLLPAVSCGGNAVSFLVPAINNVSLGSVDYNRMHEVASLITDLYIPDLGIAQDWAEIATQWEDVGVPVARLGFHELTDWFKEKAKTVADIPVSADPYHWLAQLFLLGADLLDDRVDAMVNGLLPDQRGEFRNTKTEYLYGDAGVPEEVKSIADLIEIDLPAQLLHPQMADALNAPGFEPAKELIWRLLDKQDDDQDYAESDALKEILDSLSDALPDDADFDSTASFPSLRASARLAQYLWESGLEQHLRQCPLLTAEDKIVRLTGGQQILAPVSHWPESARPYAHLYTERRILSDRYCDDDTVSGALSPLIAAGLVLEAPLYRGPRSEIDDLNLLNAMASEKFTETRVTVRGETFGQIAFLATDLVQRCGQDSELAQTLLDFVLNVAAKEDNSWREVNQISGNSAGQRISLSLYGATWPFELKVRSWVPVQIPDEDGFQPMPANESNLREMLDHAWLRNNPAAVDLLHLVFGFRQLTLLIDSLDAEVESGLVTLLQDSDLMHSVASNPELVTVASNLAASTVPLDSIQQIIQDVEDDPDLIAHIAERREQKRRVNENQNLGYHVEDLVRESLEGAGFAVKRTGVGSDFEISAELGDVANLELTLGNQSWLVEVKSTRDQRVRMTDTQAKTAVREGDAFLLCVVPVSEVAGVPELDEVRAAMRFVQNCGQRLEHLCNNLGDFENQRDAITAEESEGVQLEITSGQARVRVFSSVWEKDGFPLDELADRLAATITP